MQGWFQFLISVFDSLEGLPFEAAAIKSQGINIETAEKILLCQNSAPMIWFEQPGIVRLSQLRYSFRPENVTKIDENLGLRLPCGS